MLSYAILKIFLKVMNSYEIMPGGSPEACRKGNAVLLVVTLGTLACIDYSSMMFIPAKKRTIERAKPAKIPADEIKLFISN